MQLHEQTQRFILLLIFYLLGPILTLGIIGGIVMRKLPSHARSWERSLAQQTGLHWSIQSVEYRSPGFVRLHAVQILDESRSGQRPIFEAPLIDVRLITDTSRDKIFPGIPAVSPSTGLTALMVGTLPAIDSANQFWQISVPFASLDFGQYSSEDSASLVQNMLRKIFARFENLSEVPVQFVCEKIVIVSEYSLQKEGNKNEDKVDIFHFVQGNIYQTSDEVRSDWAFQIKGVSELDWEHRERLSFTLSLNNTFQITFQSGRHPISCDLAAVFCSTFKHFSGGVFQGKFTVSSRSGNNAPSVQLENVTFKNVPLAPLVQPYTPFAVTGTIADLQLETAMFGTESTYAKGHLLVVDGAIESALFHRCMDNFDLRLFDLRRDEECFLDSSMSMIPFAASAIHFILQPEGIDFRTDKKWVDVIMYQEADMSMPGWRVRLPVTPQRIVSIYELMSIFVPDGAPVVPISAGLKTVLPVIPTPH